MAWAFTRIWQHGVWRYRDSINEVLVHVFFIVYTPDFGLQKNHSTKNLTHEEKQPTTPPEETPAPPQEETPATPATLAGTTWKITSSTDDGVFPGISLTFHEDKTVTTDSPDFTVGLTYEAKGNTLKIVWLWGGAYNEYMEGPLTIEGNTATYTFNWFNMDGSCNTIDDPRTLTLQKQ